MALKNVSFQFCYRASSINRNIRLVVAKAHIAVAAVMSVVYVAYTLYSDAIACDEAASLLLQRIQRMLPSVNQVIFISSFNLNK